MQEYNVTPVSGLQCVAQNIGITMQSDSAHSSYEHKSSHIPKIQRAIPHAGVALFLFLTLTNKTKNIT